MTTGPDLERLGRAIRLYRDITNLTQDEIAQRGGPSDVTIRGLENGSGKKPNGATLRKIDRGLKWPEGFAAKLLSGDAELYEDLDPEEGRVPSFMDFTTNPMDDAPPPSEEDMAAMYESWAAERPIYEQSTADLIAELAGRYRQQEKRIHELELELASVRRPARRRSDPGEPRRVITEAEFLRRRASPLVPDDEDLGQWAGDEEHFSRGADTQESWDRDIEGDVGTDGVPQRDPGADRSPGGRPREQDEYGPAAARGRNRGREARQQQDREAEDGGA